MLNGTKVISYIYELSPTSIVELYHSRANSVYSLIVDLQGIIKERMVIIKIIIVITIIVILTIIFIINIINAMMTLHTTQGRIV